VVAVSPPAAVEPDGAIGSHPAVESRPAVESAAGIEPARAVEPLRASGAASAMLEPRLGELPPRLLALIAGLVIVAFAVGLVIGLIVH
jgi:hypothetical protein